MILLNLLWSAQLATLGSLPMPSPRKPSYDPYVGLGAYTYRGQIGQDELVAWLTHFRTNGTFLDVGAYNGVDISNTYFLEKTLGWNGICVEALDAPKTAGRIRAERSCKLYTNAVWDMDGEQVEFTRVTNGVEVLSGVVSAMSSWQVQRYESAHAFYATDQGREEAMPFFDPEVDIFGPNIILPVTTRTISSILEAESMLIVDFLSLDVEGAELRALQGLDFNRFVVNIMAIEDNYFSGGVPNEANPLIRLLESTGLYFGPIVWEHDIIFVRKVPIWSWEAARPKYRFS